jgi:hypothetical protein
MGARTDATDAIYSGALPLVLVHGLFGPDCGMEDGLPRSFDLHQR